MHDVTDAADHARRPGDVETREIDIAARARIGVGQMVPTYCHICPAFLVAETQQHAEQSPDGLNE